MQASAKDLRTYSLHLLLFIITFFTTTLAGVEWVNKDPFELGNFHYGLPYSLSLLAMLSAHEFGHYFAARSYGIQATLPYFIPIPPPLLFLNPFGTMGAVIRIRSGWSSRKALFDIGIAGPIAGLVVTFGLLAYGLMTLPAKEYIYMVHPEYRVTGIIPEGGLTFGTSALFWLYSKISVTHGFFPPMNEIYHYPFLCVGWFGLFVTALNLLPVGQLDGGHILYALTGSKMQGKIARVFFLFLIVMGLGSLIPLLGWKLRLGTLGWLLWAAILFFIIKLDHPAIPGDEPLTPGRKFLGWATMVTFLLIFPPVPFLE
jgi:membrane-associated protease RseP (regulator of RpoE activity)